MKKNQSQIRYDKGFIVVASCHSFYKTSALNLIDSLDEYYPDCKVMVVCHEDWKEDFAQYPQVVEIRTDCPNERRTKLWALQHTVFEKTCYLDADMEVESEEIENVWDLLDEEHDVAFGTIFAPSGASTAIYREEGDAKIRAIDKEKHLRYHGGFFLWWHNDQHPNAIKAMKLWWEKWISINQNPDWWDRPENQKYFPMNRGWDQFTWWKIHMEILPELKIQEIENNSFEQYKWNWSQNYGVWDPNLRRENYTPIINHRVINRTAMDEIKDGLVGGAIKGG